MGNYDVMRWSAESSMKAKDDRGEWRCAIEDHREFLEAVPWKEDVVISVLPSSIRMLEVDLDRHWRVQELILVAERWSSIVPECNILGPRL